MNKFLTLMLAGVLTLGSLNAEAARRLGGGKSIGQQSSNVTQREAVRPQAPVAPAQQAAPAPANKPTPAPVQAAPKKPWGAMLGGLAAGLGLAWLAHSLGFGEAFGNVLMIALLAMVAVALIGMFLRRRAPATPQMAYQGAGTSADQPASFKQYNPEKVGNDASARPWESQSTHFDSSAPAQTGSMIGAGLRGPQGWGIPADFDVSGFVDAAKRNFITLQNAWDRADISSLRAIGHSAVIPVPSSLTRINDTPPAAVTTSMRVAPASVTAPTVVPSMPPMANHGRRGREAACRTSSSPTAGRPGLVGVAWTGPTPM